MGEAEEEEEEDIEIENKRDKDREREKHIKRVRERGVRVHSGMRVQGVMRQSRERRQLW